MEPLTVGILSLAAIAILIYAGIHVAIALGTVSYVGVWIIKGSSKLASSFVMLAATEGISDYVFGVVPLFVLMGLVVSESEMGRDTFAVASHALRKVRAGLGMATVISNAIFAAITGISIASAAVFAKVSVPEMIRNGYHPRLAVGIVTGSSVLGMLIPPSLLLILFAILTETSVGDLFMAGVVPGILLALAFCTAVGLYSMWRPEHVQTTLQTLPGERTSPLLLLPVVGLAGIVLGGIYTGWFTPTEAGAIGAMAALVIATAMRRLDWPGIWRITVQTGHITASVCFLIVGATIYGRMLALSGLPAAMTHWVITSSFGPLAFLFLFGAILILLGTILDSSSIMLVTIPLAFPIALELGINPIHFGIVSVIAVEIGLLTPPLGLSAFVVSSTLKDSGITLGDVFAGSAPFAIVMGLFLVLIILFPALSLALV